jgi:hypothetical protein
MLFVGVLALGAITELQAPSSAYCAELPANNATRNDLRAQAAQFPSAVCGKYRVSCPNVDDMAYFTLEVPAVGAEKGRVVSMSGHRGTSFHVENMAEYAHAGLRTVAVSYEMDTDHDGWLCARDDCPDYLHADEPGVKDAACRPATIVHHYRQDGEALCAQGHSTGTAALAYTLAWYGGEDWLDYVQLTAFMPAARMDYGCDPARYGPETRSYVGTNPNGSRQAVANRHFDYDSTLPFATETFDMSNGLPAGTCGAHPVPGVTDEQAARLARNSVVSEGADYTYPDTVVDHFACLSRKSVTDGQGSWWLEQLQSANPGRVFMQAQEVPSGSFRHFGQQRSCTGEEVWWKEDGRSPSPLRQLTVDRMIEQCVLRHRARP